LGLQISTWTFLLKLLGSLKKTKVRFSSLEITLSCLECIHTTQSNPHSPVKIIHDKQIKLSKHITFPIAFTLCLPKSRPHQVKTSWDPTQENQRHHHTNHTVRKWYHTCASLLHNWSRSGHQGLHLQLYFLKLLSKRYSIVTLTWQDYSQGESLRVIECYPNQLRVFTPW